MKAFWALIAVLMAAAAALLLMGKGGSPPTAQPASAVPSQTAPAPTPVAEATTPAPAPRAVEPAAPLVVANAAAAPPAPIKEPEVAVEAAPVAEAVPALEPAVESPVPVAEPAKTPAAAPSEPLNPIQRAGLPEAEAPAAVPAPAPAKPAPSAMTKVVRDDGTILINDRWVIKGEGTSAKPYEVTWEYLISAGETYDPKAGQNVVPEHIAMLDGAHVRITGWIAFPLYVQSATELLAMLNQWDGCCIGVPPTPYDAIEVRLKAPAEGDDRMATFGTIEGLFGVKPYVVGGWLVGLYVMEQARIVPGRFNDGGS